MTTSQEYKTKKNRDERLRLSSRFDLTRSSRQLKINSRARRVSYDALSATQSLTVSAAAPPPLNDQYHRAINPLMHRTSFINHPIRFDLSHTPIQTLRPLACVYACVRAPAHTAFRRRRRRSRPISLALALTRIPSSTQYIDTIPSLQPDCVETQYTINNN